MLTAQAGHEKDQAKEKENASSCFRCYVYSTAALALIKTYDLS